MSKLKIHAGDFGTGTGSITLGVPMIPDRKKPWKMIPIDKSLVEDVMPASEANITKLGGAAGWGTAGALLLGPAGLIAGALLGGRDKKTTFIITFKDGKKLLGECDAKHFPKVLALGM